MVSSPLLNPFMVDPYCTDRGVRANTSGSKKTPSGLVVPSVRTGWPELVSSGASTSIEPA